MLKDVDISLFDTVMCLSDALDLISPVLVGHHKQVAYIAFEVAAEIDLPAEEQNNIAIAGLLHDSGALTLAEKLDFMKFEIENPYLHAELGFRLFKGFDLFPVKIAELIRHHHIQWKGGQSNEFKGEEVFIGSHILHLADRISVLIDKNKEIFGQVEKICAQIEERSSKMFNPLLVNAFKCLAQKEYFWLNTSSLSLNKILARKVTLPKVRLDIDGLLSLCKLFSHIVDFRSRFTAKHSSGVASVAESLARLIGFSEYECLLMRAAGFLHDLGKLAVPAEILEKPAKLTDEEFNIVKSHSYHSYQVLSGIPELHTVNIWGSLHHECLDGSGYPFHYDHDFISFGSRIMAVADVFTALTEDRPYRDALTKPSTLQIMGNMSKNSKLDPTIVKLLELNYGAISKELKRVQFEAEKEYQSFYEKEKVSGFRLIDKKTSEKTLS